MDKQAIIGLVIIAALLGGGIAYFVMSNGEMPDKGSVENNTSQQESESSKEMTEVDESSDAAATTSGVVITFTDNGFDKATYTVKAGQAVTVKNNSSMSVQFSSDDHPTHTENSEMNMRTLASGESGTFTPTTKGIHGFHDHINDQFTGTLVVE